MMMAESERHMRISSISLAVDERVVLNIGGTTFVTLKSTLQNVPKTRLAKLTESDAAYDSVQGEYYFDRNPHYFSYILDYYRTGRLHFSHCLCGPSIKAELDFWQLDENCISACCWRAYKSFEDERSTLEEMKDLFKSNIITTDLDHAHEMHADQPLRKNSSKKPNWFKKWSNIIWGFVDEPTSSKAAQLWGIVMFLLILVSIAAAAMETHPLFRIDRDNSTLGNFPNTTNSKLLMYYKTDAHPSIFILEGVCVFIFSFELIIRIIVCPSKISFFKSFYNVIDILCVLPFLITFIIDLVRKDFWLEREFIVVIGYLSLSSVLRIFRLFKMARHYKSFRLMVLAVKSSIRELLLLILLITMGMLIFSTLIYFAEFQVEGNFTNIPIGFWWSIVTMTTVGYGDINPDGVWGYLVGGICAVSGTLITGLPIPIIASNFNRYYNNARLITKIAARNDPKTKWINLDQRTLVSYNQNTRRRNGLAPLSARSTLEARPEGLYADHSPAKRGALSVFDLRKYSNVVVPSVQVVKAEEPTSHLGESFSKDSCRSCSPKSGMSLLSSNMLIPKVTQTKHH